MLNWTSCYNVTTSYMMTSEFLSQTMQIRHCSCVFSNRCDVRDCQSLFCRLKGVQTNSHLPSAVHTLQNPLSQVTLTCNNKAFKT